MREILFKGFAPNENGKEVIYINSEEIKGDWVFGSLLQLTTGDYIVPVDSYYNEIDFYGDIINALWEDNDFKKVIPETVSQFTGLIDKNGNKIFEGHILSIRDDIFGCDNKDNAVRYRKYLVEWSNRDFGFVLKKTKTNELSFLMSAFDNDNILDSKKTEVIGNRWGKEFV